MNTTPVGPTDPTRQPDEFLTELERATRGLLDVNVLVLDRMEKRIGLAPLRALQALDRLGPSRVTELGDELGMLPSTASRLSDRLADAGYITRRVAPTNRRATLLELTDSGRAVLDELIALRVHAFGEVTRHISQTDCAALIQGARAFTAAHRKLSERSETDDPDRLRRVR
ncbi:MarR family transcriptional regulator [Mycolicibacterium celeriflavum]|uniref:MarR family transcriptional regulator n=1 Tax=Mycolicibacterium celeriflavum TaxID=1249101 RepID=A0A1X0BTN7_MYCCF|nr:MarR family transcriptional regulator [Mycolicibacterium celeriflavum]MCV7239859.1 MarR family transcriptional regulator [Mycolicibacterium celeriflavum]OBG14778.1 MarR family transcriptional regulator [Mycolicibacterium celeriflavum]ORA47196.1 MarR family transcriptional regulator [Mycolicibacterium celeriflavum]BBY44297.1 MarR family transcriptional regulator [Mycolicibacterium celeriflavum]